MDRNERRIGEMINRERGVCVCTRGGRLYSVRKEAKL